MGKPNTGDMVQVTLRAEGPGPDLSQRLRLALKHLLRTHGLRAVAIEDVPTRAVGDGAVPGAEGQVQRDSGAGT